MPRLPAVPTKSIPEIRIPEICYFLATEIQNKDENSNLGGKETTATFLWSNFPLHVDKILHGNCKSFWLRLEKIEIQSNPGWKMRGIRSWEKMKKYGTMNNEKCLQVHRNTWFLDDTCSFFITASIRDCEAIFPDLTNFAFLDWTNQDNSFVVSPHA